MAQRRSPGTYRCTSATPAAWSTYGPRVGRRTATASPITCSTHRRDRSSWAFFCRCGPPRWRGTPTETCAAGRTSLPVLGDRRVGMAKLYRREAVSQHVDASARPYRSGRSARAQRHRAPAAGDGYVAYKLESAGNLCHMAGLQRRNRAVRGAATLFQPLVTD